MICYFDTSAFVPLLVAEPGTALATRLWTEAEQVTSSHLLYVEAAAALAQAQRLARLTRDGHRESLDRLDELFAALHVVPVDEQLVRRAARLADDLALRGYDAVHCATAERLADARLVVVSGDLAQLRACRDLGLATADTSGRTPSTEDG